jgi:hypothetical protein
VTRTRRWTQFALGLLPFVLLATANSAGYRYGASDLAFYGPAVMRNLEPQLFPVDRDLIDAQARLTLMDESVGALARVTTRDLPDLFLGLYLATLVLLAVAAAAIGDRLYRCRWSTVALLAALTLRHAVPRSGTNTLEAYFHPRQLAFAFGLLAVAAFLRGRTPLVAAGLIGAALLHPTTTLWFGIWMGVSIVVAERRWRAPVGAMMACGVIAAVWAFKAGPLAGRLGTMDPAWLEALGEKDYLFPLRWPVYAWVVNMAYGPIIWLLYRRRVAAGVAQPREQALVVGVLSLVIVFFVALVLNGARVALAIQLQPARVFWMLDVMAITYGIWLLAEGWGQTTVRPHDGGQTTVRPHDGGQTRVRSRSDPMVAAAVLILFSVIRGVYVMRVEFPGRSLFETGVSGDWAQFAAWAQTTTVESRFLADPNHAAQYGTSLRMAAARDVFVEAAKDGAIGMYDRTIALRTRERIEAARDFAEMNEDRGRQMAVEHGLDYLVTERDLRLPQAFRAGTIRVYQLR